MTKDWTIWVRSGRRSKTWRYELHRRRHPCQAEDKLREWIRRSEAQRADECRSDAAEHGLARRDGLRHRGGDEAEDDEDDACKLR